MVHEDLDAAIIQTLFGIGIAVGMVALLAFTGGELNLAGVALVVAVLIGLASIGYLLRPR